MDMAVGGQGAPMVPVFHEWLFADATTTRVILNLGGIANLTLLAPGRDVVAWDTGPANTLSDAWTRRCLGAPYDDGGRWASGGSTDESLLELLLDEPYFAAPPPKSTGRERFNETWLKQKLDRMPHATDDADVAATLIELSARTIADAIAGLETDDFELIACGGGTANGTLMRRLGELTGTSPRTTSDYGLDPAWVEAAAMAWLARARVELEPGNRPTVTAAREARVLGGLYSGG
jgi:anhydro-N-acetylmuramic acid kinase